MTTAVTSDVNVFIELKNELPIAPLQPDKNYIFQFLNQNHNLFIKIKETHSSGRYGNGSFSGVNWHIQVADAAADTWSTRVVPAHVTKWNVELRGPERMRFGDETFPEVVVVSIHLPLKNKSTFSDSRLQKILYNIIS